ncbi:MAG: copper oxidase [Deltaproteobacteria bacterium]|nr:copper oxidase [Deltaproteobacteria bacterium]
MDRRNFVSMGALVTGAAAILRGTKASGQAQPRANLQGQTPSVRAREILPGQPAVVTPNGVTLPWRIIDGVKVAHMVAEEFEHEFAPGLRARVWGYNGHTPGPTIEAIEGDRLRIYVTNHLPEFTTVHWHGLILACGQDGVSGLTQRPIPPGETYVYEFDLRYPGTYMYHPHYDEMTQIAMGMHGMFIVHPRRLRGPRVDRDFVLMTHEWKIDAGARRPNPNAMADFNVLTFNSKSFPATSPLVVGRGERVRIRLGNLSPMDHHPIHIHGVNFKLTATDGGYVPESAQHPETTQLVQTGSAKVIEMVFEESGDWAMHCHMTHHGMMQMGHNAPNTVGARTGTLDRRMSRVMPDFMTMGATGMGGMGEMPMPVPANSLPMRGGPGRYHYIDMGGMFTVVKVRDRVDGTEAQAQGWYEFPEGTVSGPADPARMAADGVTVPTRGR